MFDLSMRLRKLIKAMKGTQVKVRFQKKTIGVYGAVAQKGLLFSM